jgi:hypothetical protein
MLIVAPAPAERSRWGVPLAAIVGAVSLALLFISDGSGRLAAVTSAYIVVTTAAFVAMLLVSPGPILRQAVRATTSGLIVTALMIEVLWRSEAWSSLAWEATRQASLMMRVVVEQVPDAFRLYEPVVRFASVTWPGMLILQTLAGLTLAWHLHRRITRFEFGAALGRFRDFCIGDAWVWGIVAWLGVLIVPVSSVLHVAGTNLGLIAGVLYVLRGAAIVLSFADAVGISVTALVIAAVTAAALAVPLLFVLPGLCTLGITDTWYHYRRRLAAARNRNTTPNQT